MPRLHPPQHPGGLRSARRRPAAGRWGTGHGVGTLSSQACPQTCPARRTGHKQGAQWNGSLRLGPATLAARRREAPGDPLRVHGFAPASLPAALRLQRPRPNGKADGGLRPGDLPPLRRWAWEEAPSAARAPPAFRLDPVAPSLSLGRFLRVAVPPFTPRGWAGRGFRGARARGGPGDPPSPLSAAATCSFRPRHSRRN